MVLSGIPGAKEFWLGAWSISVSNVLIEHHHCTARVPYRLMNGLEFIDMEETRSQLLKQCQGSGIQIEVDRKLGLNW